MAATWLLGGRYRLIERLGEGGMSVVWRAYDEALGRDVAVKLLTARYLAHASSRVRIRTEAQAAARLSHPHITSVHDYGESATEAGASVPYVVMELLSGSTLADRLRAGPLPVRAALQVCAQVASALAAAHGTGLVHRDVKPANVMLTPAGAKVLDFGLAAAAGAPDESMSDGQVWGTPAYLAPERLTAGEVVPASDVYALGLLLYATLTGRRPWPAETLSQLLDAHQYQQPAPLPPIAGLPAEVAALCHRCLAKDARDRPAAHEAARVLAEAVGWRVSPAVAPWSGAQPDPLAAVYSRRLADGPAGRSGLRAAAPARDEPARQRAGSGAGRWRAMALAGSAAAVIASLSTGLWAVEEEPGARYGGSAPVAAGLGAAIGATPGPMTVVRRGEPPLAAPPDQPGPVDRPAAGAGSGGGASGPTANPVPSTEPAAVEPPAGAAPGGEPTDPAASSEPPASEPPASEPPPSEPPTPPASEEPAESAEPAG